MNIKMLSVLLLGFSVIGCQSTANYDYDNSVDFSQLKTYAWVVESKSSVDDDASFYLSDISHRRMLTAIDNGLSGKGLTKVAPAKADILVNYHANVDKKLERDIEPSHSYYWDFGHYYHPNHLKHSNHPNHLNHSNYLGWNYNYNRQLREYKEGTLVIDLINNQHQLIWRGAKGSRLTSQQTPQERTKRISETVATILENFPPKG